MKPLMAPSEASDIIERRQEDANYLSGPISQDRQILTDPDFQDYHRRIVAGAKVVGTVEYIRRESRMHSTPPRERVRQTRDRRLKPRQAMREMKGLLQALRAELREAKGWLAGRIPRLRHMPPSVAEIVRLWRTRAPKDVALEREMRSASLDGLRAEIGGDKPAHVIALAAADVGPELIAAEIAAARPHWQEVERGIEEGIQAAEAEIIPLTRAAEIEAEKEMQAKKAVEAEHRAQEEAAKENVPRYDGFSF